MSFESTKEEESGGTGMIKNLTDAQKLDILLSFKGQGTKLFTVEISDGGVKVIQ